MSTRIFFSFRLGLPHFCLTESPDLARTKNEMKKKFFFYFFLSVEKKPNIYTDNLGFFQHLEKIEKKNFFFQSLHFEHSISRDSL